MAAQGSDQTSERLSREALRALKWPRRLTLAGLWAERLARAFWPLWTLVLLAFSAAAFGLHEVGTLVQMQIGLGLVAVLALAALIWGWRKFRRPTADDALIRLDASLPGRPIATLRDHQAIGADDAQSSAVWRVHLARMAEKARAARAVPPDLQLASRDRWSLRYVALTAAVMAALFGSFWRAAEVVTLGPGPAQAIPAGPVWEGWARPPAYTGKPVLYLNDITAGGFEVPVGTRIQIRIYGDGNGPEIEQTIAQVAPPEPEPGKAEKAAAIPEGLRGLRELVVSQSGRLAIGGDGGREWQVTATPDAAPTIAVSGEMGREADGRFKQEFKASDDYGVTAGRVTISLQPEKVTRRYGLTMEPEAWTPVTLDLPMPMKGSRAEITQTLVDDLSEHMFSNMPVSMVFTALDAGGNEGSSAPYEVTLPGRRFFDPMANAVIEMRRDILWNRANLPRVLELLKAIGNRPEELPRSQNAAKRLRVLVRGMDAMAQPLTDAQRDEVVKELWDIAFMFEEGDLGNAFDRLQRAQDRLEEAMKNGASSEEIDQLMKEMQQAMREYLKELGQQAPQNGDRQDGEGGQGGRTITQDQLQKMLDEIERLMKEGKTAEAMALMEQLRELMQNLQAQEGQGQGGEGQGQGQGTMKDLGETLKDQQGLSDDAYRDMQRGRNGQQGTDPGELADRQRALREKLDEMQSGKLPGDGSEKGEAGRERLTEAERAMREAEEALRQGDLAGALDKQAEAMEKLREGMRDFGDALAQEREPGAEGGNQDPREARRVDPNAVDPLGREPGDSARIGSDRNMVQNDPDQRAQELLDEIRRRSGEAGRPDAELDYLKRLLDLF